MEKIDILSCNKEEIEALVLSAGEKRFRADQLMNGLKNGAKSFREIHTLPKSFLEWLEERCTILNVTVAQRFCSSDGTIKYLMSLYDGEYAECVFMRYKHGNSVCISTQVGCRMGCSFCASTINGKVRDLMPSEMLGQVLAMEEDTGERVSNIVLMGMGEPLDNYDNVLKFLHIVNMPEGRNIGMRHISLSTCGLVDKIDRLRAENLQINLSISLHAPNDEIRSRLMPINNKWKIDELLAACHRYIDATNRRIHFEYTVVPGVNDSDDNAHELANRLNGMLCHVNLIPVNPVKERKFITPDKKSVQNFCKVLNNCGICATIRRTLGEDVDASCGQLRRRATENTDKA